MATPIGVLGGIRGTFLFNLGVAGFSDRSLDAWSSDGLVGSRVQGQCYSQP